jgi:hypothetical protein
MVIASTDECPIVDPTALKSSLYTLIGKTLLVIDWLFQWIVASKRLVFVPVTFRHFFAWQWSKLITGIVGE